MKKGKISQQHIHDYVLFQFDGLLETLDRFNYPDVYSLVTITKNEFNKQSGKRVSLQNCLKTDRF